MIMEGVNPWRSITIDELAQHADLDNQNAWMAVKGIVYDVSAYAASHPGGIEKIRKYAGKDATDTFNAVHAYVPIEAILGEYQVAILKGHPGAPRVNLLKKLKCVDCMCLGKRYKPPTTSFRQDSIVGIYLVEFSYSSEVSDWTIGIIDKIKLHVFKKVDHKTCWFSSYELPEPLENDEIEIELKHNAEHAEITVRKPLPTTVWAKQVYGLREAGEFYPLTHAYGKYDAFITYKKCLTSNILMFGMQVVRSARIGVPMGFHVYIHVGDVSRPYTPVIFSLPESDDIQGKPPEDGSTVLFFMIKIYGHGALTKALDEIELDEGEEIPTVRISTPLGFFNKDFLDQFHVLFLIAGGTGITPMIKILKHFMQMHNKTQGRQVALIYFCEKDHDLIWRKQFTQMDGTSSWFYYFPVLTKPSATCEWEGLTGRITPELVETCMKGIAHTGGLKKACICGSPGFNAASVEAINGIVLSENIFVFAN